MVFLGWLKPYVLRDQRNQSGHLCQYVTQSHPSRFPTPGPKHDIWPLERTKMHSICHRTSLPSKPDHFGGTYPPRSPAYSTTFRALPSGNRRQVWCLVLCLHHHVDVCGRPPSDVLCDQATFTSLVSTMTLEPKSSSVAQKGDQRDNTNTPAFIRQVVDNVQVSGGDLNIVGGDLVQYHHHYYNHYEVERESDHPPILDKVPNFRKLQIATLAKATEGTGDWICVWNEFGIWLAPDGYIRVLWGSGLPGTGKTILTSLAIDAAESHARAASAPICVGFLYLRYSEDRVTVRDLLEVLVKQTIERHPASLPLCDELYARHIREQTEPSAKELLVLLKRFASELMMATYYFLDAIDEPPTDVQRDLLQALSSLNELSRSMELQAILAEESPGLQGRITSAIKKKCSGIFLHASLHLDALKECMTTECVEKTLKEFPPGIADVYAKTWTRIMKQSSKKAHLAKCLRLRHAVARCTDTFKFDSTLMVPAETLVSVCCGLIIIEKESGLVRLLHYTAKDVLQRLVLQTTPSPHALNNCLERSARENIGFNTPACIRLLLLVTSWAGIMGHDASKHRLSKFIRECQAFPIIPSKHGSLGLFGPRDVAAHFDLPPSL
ncbi:hypothetical protein BKA70DRAFT_1398828, partial [Coprinopsis sp. MPI-PUGE-AT-0042]